MSDIRYIADKLYESKDEYISKRDASLTVNAAVTGSESKETMEALAAVLVNIHHVPLADVAPVVHGHWIREYHENNVYSIHFVCSNCKTCMETTRYERKCSLKFCPECGAKMDESEVKDEEKSNA